MANETARSSVLPQIIVAVVIALLVGGTSPWWWKELHPQPNVPESPVTDPRHPVRNPSSPAQQPTSPEVSPTSTPAGQPTPAADIGGPMEVRCDSNPYVIPAGGTSELVVHALSSQNTPVSSANVKIYAGGGTFTSSGGRIVLGTTATDGSFRTVWQAPNGVAFPFGFDVRVIKSGFDEGKGECTVKIG